jgi:hypothetical protein
MAVELTTGDGTTTRHRVIDGDQHVTEPPDLWTSRMSSRTWGEWVPRVVFDDTIDPANRDRILAGNAAARDGLA